MDSEQVRVISLREQREYADRAAEYYAGCFGLPKQIYEESIAACFEKESILPRWFLMLNETGDIIGGAGLIQNDFVDRVDLFPYLCTLHIKKQWRGIGLGSLLINRCRQEAKSLGFQHIYLCTDHVGYYERYGFEYLCTGTHPDKSTSRIYCSKT